MLSSASSFRRHRRRDTAPRRGAAEQPRRTGPPQVPSAAISTSAQFSASGSAEVRLPSAATQSPPRGGAGTDGKTTGDDGGHRPGPHPGERRRVRRPGVAGRRLLFDLGRSAENVSLHRGDRVPGPPDDPADQARVGDFDRRRAEHDPGLLAPGFQLLREPRATTAALHVGSGADRLARAGKATGEPQDERLAFLASASGASGENLARLPHDVLESALHRALAQAQLGGDLRLLPAGGPEAEDLTTLIGERGRDLPDQDLQFGGVFYVDQLLDRPGTFVHHDAAELAFGRIEGDGATLGAVLVGHRPEGDGPDPGVDAPRMLDPVGVIEEAAARGLHRIFDLLLRMPGEALRELDSELPTFAALPPKVLQ
jgi:hypothetical protein